MCWFRRRDDRVASNLTRDEAAARSSLITVTSDQIDLDLTARPADDATFGSVSVIRFGCAVPGPATFVDLTAPGARAITLNGAPVGPDAFDRARIPRAGLAADSVLPQKADCS